MSGIAPLHFGGMTASPWPQAILQLLTFPIPPIVQSGLSLEQQYYQLLNAQALCDMLWCLPPSRKQLIVGRSRDSDVQISDPHVSGRHVVLTQHDDQLWGFDSGSKNGTLHYRKNGSYTSLPSHAETLLEPGELLRIGKTMLWILPKTNNPVPVPLFPESQPVSGFSSMGGPPRTASFQLMTGASIQLVPGQTPFQKGILVNHIENGISLIKAGLYEAAIQHFNDMQVAKLAGFSLGPARVYGIDAQNSLDSRDVQNAIVEHAMACWFLPDKQELVQANILNLIQNRHSLNAKRQKNLNAILFHSALVQAEEWIHALQYVHRGPLCVEEASLAKSKGFSYSEEEDVAVFLWRHGVELPQEYRMRYRREAFLSYLERLQPNHLKAV